MIELRWRNWQPTRNDFTDDEWKYLCASQLDPRPHIAPRRDLQYRISGGNWQTVPEFIDGQE